MLNWYKIARSDKLNKQIKSIISTKPFFKFLFNLYGVSLDKIEAINFIEKEMEGKHAQSHGDDIYLNTYLCEDGLLKEKEMHFVIHELVHWLTRKREENIYLSDPEEIDAFSTGMAFQLINGWSPEKISQLFRPIIERHLHKEDNAGEMFNALFEKAKMMERKFKKC